MSEQKTTPDYAAGVVFCYCAEPSGEAGCKSTITGSGRLKIRGTLVDSRAAFPRCILPPLRRSFPSAEPLISAPLSDIVSLSFRLIPHSLCGSAPHLTRPSLSRILCTGQSANPAKKAPQSSATPFYLTVFRTLPLRQYRLVLLRNLLPVEYLEECLYVIRAQVLIL